VSKQPRFEARLASLAESIDWPTPQTQLVHQVSARLESNPMPARGRYRRRIALVLAAVLVVTVVFVLSPSVRQAVADLFGAAGIRIGLTSEPTPTAGAGLGLGDPVSVDSLSHDVGFEVRIPVGDDPGPPDGIYLDQDGRVTMVWAAGPTLPAAGGRDVGLLLTQFDSTSSLVIGEKLLGPETVVQNLVVEGERGLWIEGAPHTLTFLDAEGNRIEETTRLAGNVLLWEAHGVNHRLETTGDLQSALDVIHQLAPLP
jgi:hypothetical protein